MNIKKIIRTGSLLAFLSTPAFAQQELLIDASDYEVPAKVTYSAGVMVEGSDDNWLLAFRRAQLSSNSGTSGTWGFGVYDTGSTDFDAVQTCDYDELVVDEILAIPGPPGSGDFSGNPALYEWYNYDWLTHQVTSKELVYLVSNGSFCFKFQILDYDSGLYLILTDEVN